MKNSSHNSYESSSKHETGADLDINQHAAYLEKRQQIEHEHDHEKYTGGEREQQREKAHHDALETADSTEQTKHPIDHEAQPDNRRHGPLSKKQLEREFNQTMNHVREDMSPTKRAFSKLIHQPTVEKTSDALAATVARPNALLAGSIGAFALTLGIYIFAKNMGYTLSGFEPIAAFLIGWICGLLYDYFRIMITGKR